MPDFPKIRNPFEDDTDFIDSVSATDAAKEAAHELAKKVNKEVVQPTVDQVSSDQIVDFLYGVDETASQDPAAAAAQQAAGGTSPEAGIEQLTQGGQTNPQQAAKIQQIMDPDKQMASAERSMLTKEQLAEREKARLHQRNYYTMQNKLDDIGYLEEQVAKVRQQKQQEEEERKKEEEEEEERKKQEEEEKKQQLAPPTGKKTGVPQDVLKREQNKAENKTGFSG